MAERTLRLTVAASADRSLSAVVQPLVDSFERAKNKVAAGSKAMGESMKRAAKEGADPLGKSFDHAAERGQRAFKQIEEASAKAAAKEAADAERAAQAKVRAEQRAWDERLRASQRAEAERLRAQKRAEAEFERQLNREIAAEERAATKRAAVAQRKASTIMGVGRDAVGTAMGMGRTAVGFAGQVAGGMGVNFDVGSSIGRGVALESKMIDIINQARLGGQDVGGDAKGRLTNLTRKVADENGLSAIGAASVLGSFQGFSSDLAGGEAVLGRLGKLAKATGTDFADMGAAAGRVNAQLVDMPEYQNDAGKRAEALLAIMRHITKQTADGSVEMSDFARYIGRIAASAQFYNGTFAENIGELGALSQMAMKGGASTASEATGSAAAFARDIKKAKTEKKWEAEGIEIYSDKTHQKLKTPQQLIVEYLQKNGASQKNLAELFPNVVSQRAVQNAISTYREAGGGKAGIAAVRGEFEKYKSTIGEDKVNELAGAKMGTTESKAQVFQNQLDRIAASMADKLLPAMESLAPKALQFADAMAGMIGWMSNNLGLTVAAAITASIGKAAIGTVLSKVIENAIANKLNTGAGGSAAGSTAGVGGKAGAALGTLGSAVAIAHIAQASFEIGKAAIDVLSQDVSKGSNRSTDIQMDVLNAISEANAAIRQQQAGEAMIKAGKDKGDAEAVKAGEAMVTQALEAQRMAGGHLRGAREKQSDAIDRATTDQTGFLEAALPFTGKDFGNRAEEEQTRNNMPEIANSIKELNGVLNRIDANLAAAKPKGGPQEVHVTNMPSGGLVSQEGLEGTPPE